MRFDEITSGPLPKFVQVKKRQATSPIRSSNSLSRQPASSLLSKGHPNIADAANSAIQSWKKQYDQVTPNLKDPFDPSASNFGRFNSHYPKSLREYFHRPRTAAAEMPRRLGKVKNKFERLSTYGLKPELTMNMKTQLHFLRNDPVYESASRSLTNCRGTMTNCHGEVVPWDSRHHNTFSRCNHVFHEVHKEFFGKKSRLERIPIHQWRTPSPHAPNLRSRPLL